jgi:hypothetical protein
MEKQSNTETFAQWSYYLGYASSGIMLLSFILGMASPLIANILWLALITSAIGTFMAWVARSELKTAPASDNVMQMAKVGWRVNLMALIVMLLLVIMNVILRLLVLLAPSMGGTSA